MSINLKPPERICVIGATSTGKTELVKKLIMRCAFGNKRELEVLVYSPSKITLEQPCWLTLKNKGIDIKFSTLDKKTLEPARAKSDKKRLIIFDDVDEACVIPKWAMERFTIASHHLGENIICISHKLKIGVITIRGSANFIILTAFPKSDLKELCKEIHADYDKVYKILTDKKGIVKIGDNRWRPYNHVVIKRELCVDADGNDAPEYFTINKPSHEYCMSPWVDE